jgi:hypothetical protein
MAKKQLAEAQGKRKGRPKTNTTKYSRATTPVTVLSTEKVIGSSCTWNKTELENFNVIYEGPESDPRSFFEDPERWLGFEPWDKYTRGIASDAWTNIVAKNQLLAIRTLEEAGNTDVTEDVAPKWQTLFDQFAKLYSIETLNRANNSTQKVQEQKALKDGSSGKLEANSDTSQVSYATEPSESQEGR